jgi:hypothetical protein
MSRDGTVQPGTALIDRRAGLPPAGHASGSSRFPARGRPRYQRTISMPPATAKAIPSASRRPFQAASSNAFPPKYPSSDA